MLYKREFELPRELCTISEETAQDYNYTYIVIVPGIALDEALAFSTFIHQALNKYKEFLIMM